MRKTIHVNIQQVAEVCICIQQVATARPSNIHSESNSKILTKITQWGSQLVAVSYNMEKGGLLLWE